MYKLQNAIQEIKVAKESIVQESNEVVRPMLEKLQVQEHQKTDALKMQLESLQAATNSIQGFVRKFEQLSVNSNPSFYDVTAFLTNFADYTEECKYLCALPCDTLIASNSNIDFSKDMRTMVVKAREYDQLKQSLHQKDMLIAKLQEENSKILQQKQTEVAHITQLYLETKTELQNWMSLVSTFDNKKANTLQRKLSLI